MTLRMGYCFMDGRAKNVITLVVLSYSASVNLHTHSYSLLNNRKHNSLLDQPVTIVINTEY